MKKLQKQINYINAILKSKGIKEFNSDPFEFTKQVLPNLYVYKSENDNWHYTTTNEFYDFEMARKNEAIRVYLDEFINEMIFNGKYIEVPHKVWSKVATWEV